MLMGREDTTVHTSYFSRPIPLRLILLLALAVHGPLLAMQLPLTNSYDSNFHVFFASHYAHHWFDPWNPKWFAGFSQTTYPPLAHQWIALLSYVFGLHMAYLLVQLVGVLLIPVGVYRFAQVWVSERAASYASLFSVFVGAMFSWFILPDSCRQRSPLHSTYSHCHISMTGHAQRTFVDC